MKPHTASNQPTQAFSAGQRFRIPVRRVGLPTGLAAIQLVLAYEWLISGINKLINPNFTVQLASTLREGMKGNPYGAYVTFLQDIVLPHASLFGVLTELGETAIGLTLVIGAALWISRPSSRLTVYAGVAASAALAGAALLSLNYFLQGGSPLPWINAANAFSEGVDIDVMIPLLSITVLVANLRAVRTMPAGRSAQQIDGERMQWAS